MRRPSDLVDRPVAAAILGALVIAFSAILVRLADVAPSTAAVFRCLYALPLLGLLAWREDRRHGPRAPRERRLGWLAGVFFAADLIFWHHGIADVGAGLATVLANLQIVLVGALAWLVLAERPERQLFVAVPIVLAGVVLISGVIGSGDYGADPARGVLFGCLTALSYAGFLLVLRQAGASLHRPAGALFDATLSATVCALIAGAALGELDLLPGWPAEGWLVLLALSSQVLGWLIISISLPRLPAALTSVLLTIQPAGSVVLGVILLSEAPSHAQLAGVVVVLAGVTVANFRPRARAPEPERPAKALARRQ